MLQSDKIPMAVDIIFCVILMPLLFFLLPVDRWMTHNSAFVYTFILWLYATYILNRTLIVPLAVRKGRKTALAAAIFVTATMVTWLIAEYPLDYPYIASQQRAARARTPHHLQQLAVWFLYTTVMSFSTAVGLLHELYRQNMARKSAELERKKAELALYKAQINPHFLFNTMNTLYGLIIAKSDSTEKAFMEFTSLMKYIYTSGAKETVSVKSELQYIRDYISLQNYRLPSATKIETDFSCDGTESCRIVPMILITFIENAFKYGVSAQEPDIITIAVKAVDGTVELTTDNRIHGTRGNGSGTGIENCRKRLELIYHDRYSLYTGEEDGRYKVRLKINVRP